MGDKEIIIKCDCGCSCLSISKWENEEVYYATLYRSYTDSFWTRIRKSWQYIIGNTDLVDTEVVLSKQDWDKIKSFDNNNIKY